MTSPKTTRKKYKNSTRKAPHIFPTLLAVGSACTLAAGTAAALELGDIQVNSALGQPLRASIAYALNPTEQLHDFCIYLRPGPASAGMPTVTRARVSIRDGMIILTGGTPVKEPMLSMQVAVDCPYTPHLLREYTLMIDPAQPLVATTPAALAQPAVVQAETGAARRAIAPARVSAARPSTPVNVRSRYRVQPGDTVSTIVSRIEDRSLGMWPSVNAIFAANSHAFANNDVNRLMAGSWLDIPDLGGASTVGAAANATPLESPANTLSNTSTSTPAVSATRSVTAYSGFQADAPAAVDVTPTATASIAEAAEFVPAPTELPAQIADPFVEVVADRAMDLRPGDVIVGDGTPVVTPIGGAEIDATEAQARTTIPIDVMPADVVSNDAQTNGWSWLIWLGGSGVALILGLLLFGRTFRERFGSAPVGHAEIRPRRSTDDPLQNVPVSGKVDFDFEDTINSRAITLDADLADGSGLQGESDMDVAEDFGFSATGTGDSPAFMEIPAEAAVELKETDTDIIPPNHRIEDTSILAEEVEMTDDDSAAYDLSMIVDATRQPIGEYDATAKDLQAVPIEASAMEVDDHTLDDAVDYDIIEQDYEDELSATQLLNAEIARAAIELAEKMEDEERAEETSEMPTIEEEMMPAAEQIDDDVPTVETLAGGTMELTAEMPASPDATVEMTADGGRTMRVPTVTDPANTAELTASLPTGLEAVNDAIVDGHDITIEMDVAGDTIETKKTKAS